MHPLRQIPAFAAGVVLAAAASFCVARDLGDYAGFRPHLLVDGRLHFEYQRKFGIADREATVLVEPEYDSLSVLSSGAIVGVKRGAVGFVQKSGHFKQIHALDSIAAGARSISPDRNGRFFVVLTGEDKWGLATIAGQWLAQPVYDFIAMPQDAPGVFPLIALRGGRTGFLDAAGRWEASRYEAIVPLDGDLFAVRERGEKKYRVQRRDGTMLSDSRFDRIASAGEAMISYEEFGERGAREAGFLRVEGNRVRKIFRGAFVGFDLPRFSEGRVFLWEDSTDRPPHPDMGVPLGRMLVGIGAYYDRSGKRLTRNIYHSGSSYVNGVAVACRNDPATKTQPCAWLDSSGRVLLETARGGSVERSIADDRVAVIRAEHGWRFFYRDGRIKEFVTPSQR